MLDGGLNSGTHQIVKPGIAAEGITDGDEVCKWLFWVVGWLKVQSNRCAKAPNRYKEAKDGVVHRIECLHKVRPPPN
jgi:hypothetical protein